METKTLTVEQWHKTEATSLNLARGDWQVSHVYALLCMSEGALVHCNKLT